MWQAPVPEPFFMGNVTKYPSQSEMSGDQRQTSGNKTLGPDGSYPRDLKLKQCKNAYVVSPQYDRNRTYQIQCQLSKDVSEEIWGTTGQPARHLYGQKLQAVETIMKETRSRHSDEHYISQQSR